MADGNGDAAGKSGLTGRIGAALGSANSRKFFGIAAMLAALAALLVLLLFGVERSRSRYFEQRNLRELDRVAENVNSTVESLRSIAFLHFAPDQLHFRVGSTNECLVATARVPGAAGQMTTIDYEFPRQILAQGKNSSTQKPLTAPGLPAFSQPGKDPCGALPPADETVSFDQHEMKLVRRLPLRDVLRPMVLSQPGKDSFAEAWQALKKAALRDLQASDGEISGGAPALVERSFAAAAAAGVVPVTIHADTRVLDVETVLEQFDAVQIFGPRPAERNKLPQLVYKAGLLPPSIRYGESGVGAAFVQALAPGSGQAHAGKPAPDTAAASDEEASLADASLYDAGDSLVFKRDRSDLEGLGCTFAAPCSIVGVVAKSRFGNAVRQLEGLPTALFLIAAITLAALIPLIHLILLKRLDPIGRRTQYVTWFSLTLLAASASIAALTAWTLDASRNIGRDYALSELKRIETAFARELDATLQAAIDVGRHEQPSLATYPAPATAPWPWAAPSPDQAILDTASFFSPDGEARPERQRYSSSAMPSFGTNVLDRPYFTRALEDNLEVRQIPCSQTPVARGPAAAATGIRYTIDRVFARPDGIAKTILLLPTRQPCLNPAGDKEFLILSGYLQTFLATATPPAFRYAVIDPKRRGDKPNILFHSRPDAELSESFAGDLDESARTSFQTLMEQMEDNCGLGPIRFSTHYRGDPAILTMDRLDPTCGPRRTDWVLVMIEHRKDAGFAIWRAVSFAYGTWMLAVLAVFAVSATVRLGRRDALDRRPGLWLWPRDVLTEFTAPRFWFEEEGRLELGEAARLRDRHVLLVLFAGIIGVVAGAGAARTLFALAAVMAAFAARSYFRGLTAPDAASGRKLDLWFIRLAWLLLVISLVISLTEPMSPGSTPGGGWGALVADGVAAFILALMLVNARRYALGGDEAAANDSAPGKWAGLLQKVLGPKRQRGGHLGWMFVLITVGALPAVAGFLDSIDHSQTLAAERQLHRSHQSQALKSAALHAIQHARGGTLEADVARRVRKSLLPGETQAVETACSAAAPDRPVTDVSLAALAIDYLDLKPEALEFSDHCPISLTAALSGARNAWQDFFLTFFEGLIPFFLLFGAFRYFRRQYFLPAPPTPIVTEDRFKPPLTCPRKKFIEDVILPAAAGEDPVVGFKNAESRLHLILGASVDLQQEPDLARAASPIGWVDLLEIANGKPLEPVAEESRVVMVVNLDVALQHAPEGTDAMLAAMESLVATMRKREKSFLFILAEIEPLDRIALLRAQCGDDAAAATIKNWRWARLLQDFTLCALVADMPEKSSKPMSVAARELQLIDTPFARALLAQLDGGTLPVGHEMEDRLIDYVAEQMADYYHRLWTSSGDEERVLLYHIAWRQHLKLEDVPALRSLLVRGLIVRSPEYRLMNKSFARYVRRIEQPAEIRKRACRADNATDEIWPLIRVPLIALAGSMLILVQLISPQQTTGAIALIPALGAILPALLGSWLKPQGSAT